MEVILPVFKIVGNISVEDLRNMVDIWSWLRCKILVELLLGLRDLLLLRDDAIL